LFLACADYTFPLLRHDDALSLISLLGLSSVDIGFMGDRSHVRPEVALIDPARSAADLAERVGRHGLTVSDVFLIPWTDFETCAPNHPEEAERVRARAMFEQTLKFAHELSAPGVTMLPGIRWPDEDLTTSLRRAADELTWRASLAGDVGLRLSVEPHIGSVIETPEHAAELATLATGVTLTLDPSHFVWAGHGQASWQDLVSVTGHVHLRGADRGRVQAPMAANAIDFRALVEGLKDHGYDAALTLEYVYTDWERCNECDNVSETVQLRDELNAIIDGTGEPAR
jgi:sugar phosphate isomerase/epimerase